MNIQDILNYLPHRYPFLLVDKVQSVDTDKLVAIKNVTFNEPFFTGHFPDRPIMPGVLMIEAMAQLGGLLCLQPPIAEGKAGQDDGGLPRGAPQGTAVVAASQPF